MHLTEEQNLHADKATPPSGGGPSVNTPDRHTLPSASLVGKCSAIARTIGVTAGVVVLAISSDPLIAMVMCLSFWCAGLLVHWPVKVLNLSVRYPLSRFKALYDLHLWTVAILLLVMLLFQPETIQSAQFWLLISVIWYHLFQILKPQLFRPQP